MFPGSVAGLPKEMPTMPQLLRKAGYSAHMVTFTITIIIMMNIAIIKILIAIQILIIATCRLENGTWATQSSHKAQLVVGVLFVVC